MNKTSIGYLDFTWNPIAMRCTPVSEGCQSCWHLRFADRHSKNPQFPDYLQAAYAGDAKPELVHDRLTQPLRRLKPTVIGVQFMGDLFHEDIAFDVIERVFGVMAQCIWHTFVVLTKRPMRMREWAGWEEDRQLDNLYHLIPNVIGMVTAENQQRADERIPWLLKTPFAKRGVSVEPMLGPVDLKPYIGLLPTSLWPELDEAGSQRWLNERTWLDWVICGAETGPRKRPMDLGWARNLRDQCQAANAPFYFKVDSNGNHTLFSVTHEEHP